MNSLVQRSKRIAKYFPCIDIVDCGEILICIVARTRIPNRNLAPQLLEILIENILYILVSKLALES